MPVRKSAARLTATERDNFLAAVTTLKKTIANPRDPASKQISIFDQFVAIHLGAINIRLGAVSGLNMGHQNSAFCPWHRYYLSLFEKALQVVDPGVALPYWDWTDHFGTENILFQDDFMGPNGTGSLHGFGERSVKSGYFAFNKPGSGGNPTPLPPWWPAGLPGWRVRPSLAQGHSDPADPATGKTLQRNFADFTDLANLSDIQACLGISNYEGASLATSFRRNLEAASKTHNFHHGWVGGNMGDPNASPNDVIFFMHHCNIDRLWAMWQIDGHQGSSFYPASGRPQGHNLNDPMWPWVGSAAGYSAPNLAADIVIPDFTSQPAIRPADALDHRALGYSYDTEAVVAIALDQAASMSQMTPDPMVVAAPDVTKWEAAKRGVAALLHDCEAAYAQKEAYVVAGVGTFRSVETNVLTTVFPGVPYGVIKAGAAYSESGFTTAIATQSPAGGTSIAGALLDTEASLVRPPLNNTPAHDTRYLLVVTDGIENVAPLLSTIGAAQLQDTMIFAMGFGTGPDVDYASIADIVSKGAAAPPLVTSQVYHGENAGEINKFFTNSIAHALGYTPVVDPGYELFPGEHVDSPFYVTEADQSYMVTVQGFDYSDENWDACLVLPDGSSCACDASCDEDAHSDGHDHTHAHGNGHVHSHEHGSVLVTGNKANGRITILLNRNGADSDEWVGRWFVRVMYRMTGDNMRMFMPSGYDLIFPTGSRSVRGPLFAQARLPLRQRTAARLMPPRSAAQASFPVTGANEDRQESCAVSVNVYCRSTLRVGLTTDVPRTGSGFTMALAADDAAGGDVSEVAAIGRLVAPHFSGGHPYLDQKTVPMKDRRKFVRRTDAGELFDEARFFAEYESKKPGAFAIRDEILKIESARKGKLAVAVSDTPFPGIYRVACQVSGSVTYGDAEPQNFTRVLNYEVPVGLKVDSASMNPTWRMTGDVMTVTYSVADKAGNHASPALMHKSTLTLNGSPVTTRPINDYSGTYRLEVDMRGTNLRTAARGKRLDSGAIRIALKNGKTLMLKAGDELAWRLTVGDATSDVRPALLTSRGRKRRSKRR